MVVIVRKISKDILGQNNIKVNRHTHFSDGEIVSTYHF